MPTIVAHAAFKRFSLYHYVLALSALFAQHRIGTKLDQLGSLARARAFLFTDISPFLMFKIDHTIISCNSTSPFLLSHNQPIN
ncbi:hypothetical protein L228DRAFT_122665 [Xylona heveae TC161]|uniref:Uncharacterized protein n=1 Tax=Xylona heveae (strain CBS 132557 / TC161) TaxID=1328760 RepID=A0A165HLP6_XYLHT|nr:hypothetical protein L228DRAFT_122665 [Xylona heveae TC161]KZF23705.1 hypothetical protein L228DRAFT_122665 [Xylona heveae TC161]